MDLESLDYSTKTIRVGRLEVLGDMTGEKIAAVDSAIHNANLVSQNISASLDESIKVITEDGIISPIEKKALKKEIDAITTEYSLIVQNARTANVPDDYIALFSAKYDELIAYFSEQSIFDEMDNATEIADRNALIGFFNSYYGGRVDMQNATLVARENALKNGTESSIPDDVQAVVAVAYQSELRMRAVWTGQGLANALQYYLFEFTKDGITWKQVKSDSAIASYPYDRAIDGYLEADVISEWKVRCKVVNNYNIASAHWSPSDSGQSVDTSLYGSWNPPTTSIAARTNGRGITVSWSTPNEWYGHGKTDLQIAKGYTIKANGEIELITNTSSLVAYAPALGADPLENYETYREGTADGFLSRTGSSITLTVPLFGQNENPISTRDTPYFIRARSTSDVPTAVNPESRKLGTWSSWMLVYGQATTAQDVVRARQFTDTGDLVKVPGALEAYQIYVEALSAITANLGLITDGAMVGNENNRWAVSTVYNDDGSVKYYAGSMRVGGTNQYFEVVPVVVNGIVTDYTINMKVGNLSIGATTSDITGTFNVRDLSGNILFQVHPENGALVKATSVVVGNQSDAMFKVGGGIVKKTVDANNIKTYEMFDGEKFVLNKRMLFQHQVIDAGSTNITIAAGQDADIITFDSFLVPAGTRFVLDLKYLYISSQMSQYQSVYSTCRLYMSKNGGNYELIDSDLPRYSSNAGYVPPVFHELLDFSSEISDVTVQFKVNVYNASSYQLGMSEVTASSNSKRIHELTALGIDSVNTLGGVSCGATTIQIGTVQKGDNAEVENSGTPYAAVLNFTLPKGDPGEQGVPGVSMTIGTVQSGETPSVSNSGTPSDPVLNFVLPKGDKGDPGAAGTEITGAATTIASANLAASMALVSNASGKVAAHASVTATELGYLDGVTSAIQTQINAKQAVVSGVDSTEIGYLNGVTGPIQTQLDAKAGVSGSTVDTTTVFPVGHYVSVMTTGVITRNSNIMVYVMSGTGSALSQYTTVSGTVLTGTWRARGMISTITGQYAVLAQRVA